MDKDLADVLFEALDALDIHTERLDKLTSSSKEFQSSIKEVKSYLEKKIEESTKAALKEVLDRVNITNNSSVNVDTSDLAKEIAKLINTKFNQNISIEPQNIDVKVDTKAIADKLDNTSVLKEISNQIKESNKANQVLLTEMIKLHSKEPSINIENKSSVKSIKIIRNKQGLIDSLNIIEDK